MHRQLGLSLTELMIAITLGAFVALAGSTLSVTTVSTGKTIFNKTRATEQARAVIDTIVHDFRRVGYRGPTVVGKPPEDQEYCDPDYQITELGSAFCLKPNEGFELSQASGEAANSCITYSYEAVDDATGLPETRHYGFRLAGGTVQATSDEAATCDAATHWEAATDANSVWIDKLAFSAKYRCYDAEDGSLADASNPELSCRDISDCGCQDSPPNVEYCSDNNHRSCFERRQLSIALCAYPLDSGSAGDCQENNDDSSPEGQLYAVLNSTSRNDLLFFSESASGYPGGGGYGSDDDDD